MLKSSAKTTLLVEKFAMSCEILQYVTLSKTLVEEYKTPPPP